MLAAQTRRRPTALLVLAVSLKSTHAWTSIDSLVHARLGYVRLSMDLLAKKSMDLLAGAAHCWRRC